MESECVNTANLEGNAMVLPCLLELLTAQQQALLDELRAIHSTLKKQSNRQKRRTSTINDFVGMLLTKYPERDWTSESLAKSIGNGCTGTTVRKTKQWQEYQKYRQKDKTEQKAKYRKGAVHRENLDKNLDDKTGK
jgi:hypothetical protein